MVPLLLICTGMKSSEPLSDLMLEQWALGSSLSTIMPDLMRLECEGSFYDQCTDAIDWPSCSPDLRTSGILCFGASGATDCPGSHWCRTPSYAMNFMQTGSAWNFRFLYGFLVWLWIQSSVSIDCCHISLFLNYKMYINKSFSNWMFYSLKSNGI